MLEKISAAVNNRDHGSETVSQRNPLNLLILGGILLIAAIGSAPPSPSSASVNARC